MSLICLPAFRTEHPVCPTHTTLFFTESEPISGEAAVAKSTHLWHCFLISHSWKWRLVQFDSQSFIPNHRKKSFHYILYFLGGNKRHFQINLAWKVPLFSTLGLKCLAIVCVYTCVNSGCLSALKSSSRKHRAIWKYRSKPAAINICLCFKFCYYFEFSAIKEVMLFIPVVGSEAMRRKHPSFELEQ